MNLIDFSRILKGWETICPPIYVDNAKVKLLAKDSNGGFHLLDFDNRVTVHCDSNGTPILDSDDGSMIFVAGPSDFVKDYLKLNNRP